jgi:peptidyl-dipeptidase A
VFGNSDTESALRSTLEALDTILEPFRNRKSETQWNASVDGSEENLQASEDAEKDYRSCLANREIFNELTVRLNDAGVQDQLLRRWATHLRLEMAPSLLTEEVIGDIVGREKKLQTKVHTYQFKVDDKPVTLEEIANILRFEENMEIRKAAWEASKDIGPEIEADIRELVRARNVAGRSIGFPDFFRMNLDLQEIDEARLFSSIGSFASQTEETYRRMKAMMDSDMSDHFRMDSIDLAPWHYSDPFFHEVPNIFRANTDSVYKDKQPLDWMKGYFAGIGLPIDSILDKGDYIARDGKQKTPYTMDLDRSGDVRVLLNLGDDLNNAEIGMHEFGHAVYEMNIDRNLPHTLRKTAHQSVSEAVAMFFGRQVRDPEWVFDTFRVSGQQIRDLEDPMNVERRMRMAITSRWSMVMVHFERGLYRDPDQAQQIRWWDLVERFQLIRRPLDRKENADWATKLHIALAPVYYHNYILGEWQASMIDKTMRNDLKLKDPFVWKDDPRIGEWFKEKIFKHGAFWHYVELMRNTTGHSPQPDNYVNQFLG